MINTKQELIEYITEEYEGDRHLRAWCIDDNMGRRLDNYHMFAEHFRRCRDKAKGRKVSSAFRMFSTVEQGVKCYDLHIDGYGSNPFMRITPDNIVEFVATPDVVVQHAQSVVSSVHRWIPFTFERHRKGLYRVNSSQHFNKEYIHITKTNLKRLKEDAENYEGEMSESIINKFQGECWRNGWTTSSKIMRQSPAYFQGIKFNILSGNCLNRRFDDKFIEKPKQRKEWRQALAKFKRGIRARAKIRAFDPLIEKMWAERQTQNHYHWKQPDWSSNSWMSLLEQSIRDNKFPKELLLGLCTTPPTGYYQSEKPTSNDVYKSTCKILADCSTELRRRFNVFESEGHDERRQDKYYTYHESRNLTIEEAGKI